MSLRDTKNFKASEFACHHCGENKACQELIDICQKIRDKLGAPIRINSGYRCPVHNAKVGGVKNSYHTQGKAADLSCSKGEGAIWEAVKELYESDPEFKARLGYAIRYMRRHFVHVDVGGKRKSGRVFEERVNG